MTSLDSTVMSIIGSTLRYLTISINLFPSFPSELHFLRNLNNLMITGITFSSLRADAFSGLEASLGFLELSDSKLEKIPSAICRLQNLTQFIMNSSPNLQQDSFLSISERCSQKLTSVTILKLRQNKLQYFPDVFELFPNVQLLTLWSNNIQRVNSSIIPYNSTLNDLYIAIYCASVDNHIPRDDIFDYRPRRECNIYIIFCISQHVVVDFLWKFNLKNPELRILLKTFFLGILNC